MRQESDRLDAGDNYAIGDTESEDSGPESGLSDSKRISPVPETQASSPMPQTRNSGTQN